MNYLYANKYILLLVISILHVIEEFVFPGGFAKEFKKMTAVININITNQWLLVTNILFISLVFSSVVINTETFGLSVVSIIFINGLLHIGKSIQVKRYFPGLLTAIFLYIPAGVFAFSSFGLPPVKKFVCLLMGLLMHLVPFILLLTVFRLKINHRK